MGCCWSKESTDTYPTDPGSTVGSRATIRLQDVSVGLGHKQVILPQQIQPGPRTQDVIINLRNMGIEKVNPSRGDSDFLYDPSKNTAEFDAVCTLATIQIIANLFRNCLRQNDIEVGPIWNGHNKDIECYPWSAEILNAYYTISKGVASLHFGYYKDGGKWRVFCRSFDVIAHETGHALLDGMQPRFIRSKDIEVLALHESFGDMTAMFAVLHQLDLCKAIVRRSRGDLHNKSFLSAMYDDFGDSGLREVNNNLRVSDVKKETYAVSVVVTGAVHEVIAEMFQEQKTNKRAESIDDQAKLLNDIGHYLYGKVILAYRSSPNTGTKIADVLNLMMQTETDDRTRAIMRNIFEFRELLKPTLLGLTKALPEEMSIVCDTCMTIKTYFDEDDGQESDGPNLNQNQNNNTSYYSENKTSYEYSSSQQGSTSMTGNTTTIVVGSSKSTTITAHTTDTATPATNEDAQPKVHVASVALE